MNPDYTDIIATAILAIITAVVGSGWFKQRMATKIGVAIQAIGIAVLRVYIDDVRKQKAESGGTLTEQQKEAARNAAYNTACIIAEEDGVKLTKYFPTLESASTIIEDAVAKNKINRKGI